jgi:hypothetical protein
MQIISAAGAFPKHLYDTINLSTVLNTKPYKFLQRPHAS